MLKLAVIILTILDVALLPITVICHWLSYLF